MKKCEQGHYFDTNRYTQCPFCANSVSPYAKERDLVTVSMPVNNVTVEEVARLVSTGKNCNNEEPRTIGLFSSMKGNDFVTGWLVCVGGVEYGRDFRLHHGFNRIGCSPAMDVCISDGVQVANEIHCQIVYENKTNIFYLVPSKELIVYVNGESVFDAVQIRTGDKIEIGNTVLQLIAFCEGDRRWERK